MLPHNPTAISILYQITNSETAKRALYHSKKKTVTSLQMIYMCDREQQIEQTSIILMMTFAHCLNRSWKHNHLQWFYMILTIQGCADIIL